MKNGESVEMQRLRMAAYVARGFPKVCPQCGEGLPDCAHGLTHDEVCKVINWAADVCLRCALNDAVVDAQAAVGGRVEGQPE